jgi:hypothetical protein
MQTYVQWFMETALFYMKQNALYLQKKKSLLQLVVAEMCLKCYVQRLHYSTIVIHHLQHSELSPVVHSSISATYIIDFNLCGTNIKNISKTVIVILCISLLKLHSYVMSWRGT